jgi:glycosyltransferase involved in cell wall biosynthesis
VGDRGSEYIARALRSVASQTFARVGAIVVSYKETPGLTALLREFADQLPIEIVKTSCTGFRSTQLWAGLKAVSTEYFGVLDDDDLIHPNHVSSLLQLLIRFENCGVAYSGAIRVWEPRRKGRVPHWFREVPAEPAELALFEPFDVNRLVALNNFITSNSFIARSALIKDLLDDPQLSVAEDLFLLLNFCQKTNFIFSCEATCEFYWRKGRNDNAVWLDQYHWTSAFERLKNIFWGQRFPSTQIVGCSNAQAENERLREVIAHMERSKFWKMRQFWFRIKEAVGLDR